MKRRVFLDTGVFIAAWQGHAPYALEALALLEDPEIELCTSSLTELELLPQAEYHRNRAEAQFYRTCFTRPLCRCEIDGALVALARDQARAHGLHAMDALHVAVALRTRAQEFVTTERTEKPLYRVSALKVRRLV